MKRHKVGHVAWQLGAAVVMNCRALGKVFQQKLFEFKLRLRSRVSLLKILGRRAPFLQLVHQDCVCHLAEGVRVHLNSWLRFLRLGIQGKGVSSLSSFEASDGFGAVSVMRVESRPARRQPQTRNGWAGTAGDLHCL